MWQPVVGTGAVVIALLALLANVLDVGKGLAHVIGYVRRKAGGRRRHTSAAGDIGRTSLGIPSNQRAPGKLWGRACELRQLDRAVRRRTAKVQVLAGPGGVGKSALAAATAARTGTHWWVPASTRTGLLEGLAVVVRDCGGSEQDADLVRRGDTAGPAALARALGRCRSGWTLVLDNLDDVDVLGAHRRRLPVDGGGRVLITTRVRDANEWDDAELIVVDPLTPDQSADLLLERVTGGGDREGARLLGDRLNGFPLQLRNAAKTLTADLSDLRSFADYLAALDGDAAAVLEGGPQPRDAGPRQRVTSTYDLSLAVLARQGRPDAGQLLTLLCSLAPLTPIPLDVLPAGSRDPLRALVAHGLVQPSIAEHVEVYHVVADVHRDAGARDGAVAVVGRMLASATVRSRDVRYLVLHVLELLRPGPAGAVLVDHAARVAELLIDDRDTRTAHEVVRLAKKHRLDLLEPAALALRHAECRVDLELGRAAVDGLRAVRDDRIQVLGVDHVDAVESARWFAWAVAKQPHRYDEAGDLLAGLASVEPGSSRRHVEQRLHVLCMLGWIRCKQDDHAEAERIYREVIAGRGELLGDEHPDTLDARHSLAKVLYEQGRFRLAETRFREVAGTRRRLHGPDHPDTLESIKHEALSRVVRTRRKAHLTVLRTVWTIQTDRLGREHPSTRDTERLLTELTRFLDTGGSAPVTV